MDDSLVKEIRELKVMISNLSNLLLKVLDMEIEPLTEKDLTKEEKD